MKSLLVANRGEIAARILRAASDLGVRTVAVHSIDDGESPWLELAHDRRALGSRGPSAYLDADRIVAIAVEAGCDAIHPGYGFLSENAEFAERCEASGIAFVGPTSGTLAELGDKTRARALAARCGVPVLDGSDGPIAVEDAHRFLAARVAESGASRSALVVKALAGGGGRGLRIVRSAGDLDAAWERCRSEARAAFGDDRLYVEALLQPARHLEVQLLGDGRSVVALGERECSLQRRHQKLVEIAPCPSLSAGLRERLVAASLRMARELGYRGAGTFEFLVEARESTLDERARWAFIEANPRLQVEHPVTEEVFGVDVVRAQLEIAAGRTLAEIGLETAPAPRGFAIEVRVNAETVEGDGSIRPSIGTLLAFETPAGRGVRVETAARAGWSPGAAFDSLLAKVIGHEEARGFAAACDRTARALEEMRIEGLRTNLPFLRALLRRPEVRENRVDTDFLDRHGPEIAREAAEAEGKRGRRASVGGEAPSGGTAVGARVDSRDPLAVLAFGKQGEPAAGIAAGGSGGATMATSPVVPDPAPAPDGMVGVRASLQGTVVEVAVTEGDLVHAGQGLAVMSAMKMEHVVVAPVAGRVERVNVATGDTVAEGATLAWIEPREAGAEVAAAEAEADPERIRPDLAELLARQALLGDEARPDAVARRRRIGSRTARENVADLCDPGSFEEWGGYAIAAQRGRRSIEDLVANTPGDGMVAGLGRVNGDLFPDDRSRCAVASYDYTVLAGTQGALNHRKKDRLFELAERLRLPVVLFTEGGGGRPGDTDVSGVAGLDCMAFHLFAKLSGLVPLIGVNSGRCFAGNAALLGCCDVVIATRNSNIGMGGPAMVEGGGLGVFRPEDIGPMSVQVQNGVVDVAVEDEREAVAVAKRYLSYFQGALPTWEEHDQRSLRHAIPENRLRVYEVRSVIETLADAGSVLELRRGFGAGMVTALARVEGRPIGVVANDPRHLAGAIDAPAADKAARFLQLCDAFDLPVLFLCDTPGIMVGPEVEKTALVRHCARLFVVGASLTVPFMTIVLRKSYGLGAQAMAGGSHKAPIFTVAWPTGEFGGMGLEGAVKLGFRKELEAIADPEERRRAFDVMVGKAYERGKALNTASHFEIDDVIDPADSRARVVAALRASPPP
ncbi:MAG: carboxyl transferase domain-containing protein, partial [Alphaproteobacteria bacterium]